MINQDLPSSSSEVNWLLAAQLLKGKKSLATLMIRGTQIHSSCQRMSLIVVGQSKQQRCAIFVIQCIGVVHTS